VNKKIKSIDMLKGPLSKNLILYTLPIILSNILQLLFNAADIVVVGRFCGSISVGAVGATGSLVSLIINATIGLSLGTGVLTAQNLGSGNDTVVKKIVHTAIPTAIIVGMIVTIIGIFFSKDLLGLMNTPAETLDLATTYLTIYLCGAISLSIYNFGSSILRAAGDTKSPLIFLALASILNIALNLFFVSIFNMGVAGVALATAISQTLSAILIIIALMKRTDACKLYLSQLKIYKPILLKIMRIGVPASIQSAMFSISMVLIQASINAFGAAVLSGYAAASNIESFIYTALNALHQATLNFTAQNVGACNPKRVRKIFYTCMLCAGAIGLVLGVSAYIFGESLLSIYITDSAAAIQAGMTKIAYILPLYAICGIMETITGSVRGLGASISPMIISVFGACVLRIVTIFTIFRIPKFHKPETLYISYVASWIVIIIGLLIVYSVVFKKFKKCCC